MIKYYGGAYGLQILLRLHGSAAYKAVLPAALSTGVYIILFRYTDLHGEENVLDHPYALGALMVAFTFLLTFKANFSYSRYWEAVTSVHQMHSKWLDVGMDLVAFHLQSDMYKSPPPAFGSHPEIKHMERDRERIYNPPTKEQVMETITSTLGELKRGESFRSTVNRVARQPRYYKARTIAGSFLAQKLPTPINPVDPKTETPSLFLQEAAHLLSLLSAVAMCTLRNDVEAAEAPLTAFCRGDPWPTVDPDAPNADIRPDWNYKMNHLKHLVRYLLGLGRNDEERTMYNAARPFRVIGGVSDAEVELLQAARGPFAKVALVTLWLQEFISREYLNGSTGKVGAPIISRLYQFISDGMLGYNQARKVAYIPFPFPHSQITSLFMLIVIAYIPVLMLTFVESARFGATMTFITVMCFAGLHEVARELENPYINVPNDIPLNNFQAQFNEALMNMFVGFHPDAYWNKQEMEDESEEEAPIEAAAPKQRFTFLREALKSASGSNVDTSDS